MAAPDITYFLFVRSEIGAGQTVVDFIEKKTLPTGYSRHEYKQVRENIALYYAQEQELFEYLQASQKNIDVAIAELTALEQNQKAKQYVVKRFAELEKIAAQKRQDYIDSLWWWTWRTQTKPTNDDENIQFINQRMKDNQEFFNNHDDGANTLFGIYASSYATILFVEKILLENYAHYFVLTTPAAIAIVGIALFNLILDKYLFDYFWKDSTLDDRENAKFLMLIIITIVCASLEFYVIPVALLLYSAGYFINYMLQKGNISKGINKIFFTQDKDGIPRLFEGFAIEANAKFNSYHYAILYIGTFGLSALYGVAMATLAAMWIYPTIAGFAVALSLSVSPLAVIVCLPLVAYGVFYALFTAQAWGKLVGLYANLTQNKEYKDFGYGKFMLLALGLLLEKLISGVANYFQGLASAIHSWKDKTVLQILGSILWGTLTLTWKLVQISFSILTFYGMYYMLDQACQGIASLIDHKKSAQVLTPLSYVAQMPVMTDKAFNVAKPEEVEPEETAYLPWYSELRLSFFRLFNAARTAFVPVGGEQSNSSTHRLVVASTAGASFVLVDSAMRNARKETQESEKKKLKV